MPILIIRKEFEEFECTSEPFEKDSKDSNVYLNQLKGIRGIQMQIVTIRTKFIAFKCKFESFEPDSNHSNANSNYSKRDSKHSNANSNHLKGIRSFRIQIQTIRKGFEAFERKF